MSKTRPKLLTTSLKRALELILVLVLLKQSRNWNFQSLSYCISSAYRSVYLSPFNARYVEEITIVSSGNITGTQATRSKYYFGYHKKHPIFHPDGKHIFNYYITLIFRHNKYALLLLTPAPVKRHRLIICTISCENLL